MRESKEREKELQAGMSRLFRALASLFVQQTNNEQSLGMLELMLQWVFEICYKFHICTKLHHRVQRLINEKANPSKLDLK